MPVIPIPKRDGVDIVIGRTPLDLSDFADAHEGGFAVYAHGLTIEEAGELTRMCSSVSAAWINAPRG